MKRNESWSCKSATVKTEAIEKSQEIILEERTGAVAIRQREILL